MNHINLITCPVCDEGALTPEAYSEQIEYAGARVTAEGLERFRCDRCGADPVFAEQIRRNQTRIADAKRRAIGLLSGDEIRAVRELLDLSQPDAAMIFGGGANAFSKYERGEVIQSVPMDRLLRVVVANPWMADELRMRAGISKSQPIAAEATYTEGTSVRVLSNRFAPHPISTLLTFVSSSNWKNAA